MSSVSTEVAPRIRRLAPGLINKIAAGEVVERPASVVKELLENAVDAGATRIDVDCQQGGGELIRIVDDGGGIHPEDIELAVTAHATSKLAEADDLFRVHTMGFRGEALASIAEVSSFRLRTRPAEHESGIEIEVEGGVAKDPRPCGCPPGTSVEVRQLFLNTPVRRRFLKTPATEFAHLSEQFTRIALAQPRIHFTLRHNDKPIHDLPKVDDLSDRVAQLFGEELRSRLISAEGTQGDLRLWGYVGHPSESRASRKSQFLFVNGRWIQDRTVQHALTEAYRGLLMIGRQPICFLFLEVPPEDVDVNVHPTKAEVRFADPQRLYRLVLSSLRTRFLGMNLDSVLTAPSSRTAVQAPAFTPAPSTLFSTPRPPADPLAENRVRHEFADWAKSQLASWQPPEGIADLEQRAAELDALAQAGVSPSPHEAVEQPPTAVRADGLPDAPPPAVAPEVATTSAAGPIESPRAMQVLDCYLVVESDEGITLIDQHALHERILYEHFRRRVLERKVEVQRLLMPVVAELSNHEAAILLDHTELLEELGFEVSSFGGRSIAVAAYPVLMRKADPIELLRAVVDQLESAGQKLTRRDLIDSLLHMMACKAAIKSGHRLAPEEIDSLLAQRHMVDDHHHCPHGRPTALTLSRAELDRQFGRLG
jgi:DNA mismatch repair protein MutL